jgi:hypothetical protein
VLNGDTRHKPPVGIATVINDTAAPRPGFNPTLAGAFRARGCGKWRAWSNDHLGRGRLLFSMRYVTIGAFTGGVKG